ncbi:20S proteasome subunit beta 6 [Pseudogymnoascus sp. 24MN13]|nr:20S proteasome subunit beta 6 [Pseudogymnoascus sp. 24MN13]
MAALVSQNPVMNGPNYSFNQSAAPSSAADGYRQHRFDPYTDNGGSTLAIAGDNFAILAGDTRSTSGYNINTRYEPKVFKIGGSDSTQRDATLILSVVGFAADANALKERLDTVVKLYRYQHGKAMTVKAAAQRLSIILYQKRFFPYEREQCRAGGAAASLIMPFLDSQVNFKNQYEPGSGVGHNLKERERVLLGRDVVEDLVKDAFDSAVERHIEVGDGLLMMVITKDGIEEIYKPLKQD